MNKFKPIISEIVSKHWAWATCFTNECSEHKLTLAFLPKRNSPLTTNAIRDAAKAAITEAIKQVEGIEGVVVRWSVTKSDFNDYDRLTIGVSGHIDVPAKASSSDLKINFKKANVVPAPTKLVCPYCQQQALYSTTSNFLYHGKDYGPVYFCPCKPDGVYVGCHKGTATPLGSLSDSGTRLLRMECHKLFDPYWDSFDNLTTKQRQKMRQDMYANLAEVMELPKSQCHISMFDEKLAKKAIQVLSDGALNKYLTPLQQIKLAMKKDK